MTRIKRTITDKNQCKSVLSASSAFNSLNGYLSEMEIEDFNTPLDKSFLLKINEISKLWYN